MSRKCECYSSFGEKHKCGSCVAREREEERREKELDEIARLMRGNTSRSFS